MFWMMSAAALAGSVYVNGVNVDGLRNQTFENVSVTIDAQGNVQITAPGYRIEVVGQQAAAPPPYTASVTQAGSGSASVSSAKAPAAPQVGVGSGRWWLVTEDNASSGHSIEVWVNGQLVQTVRSGDGQLIIDIGAWLKSGANTVTMKSSSVSPGGGTFYAYVGSGNNDSGTVVLDKPQIQYGLGSSRTGPYSRDYTLTIP